MDGSGNIRSGQTAFNSGTGFFIGQSGATPVFSVGNSSGNCLTWDGTNLNVVGGGTFSGALSAATGSFGAVSVATNGSISSGQSAYNTGTGFWIGNSAGTPKFSIGNPSGSYFTWDGTNLFLAGGIMDSRTYTAGTIPIASDCSVPTYSTAGINGTSPNLMVVGTYYGPIKEIFMPNAGTVTFNFEAATGGGNAVNFKIYANGVALGTAILVTYSNNAFTACSQNVTFAANTRLQIYASPTVTPGVVQTAQIRTVNVCCGFPGQPGIVLRTTA
jgi:hypothetical protein